ncbi:hypothetical protein [Nostoc sp. LPT]|uniref:hypothetical protein n=1 Tax=Nostoc sp. LPT TaxID=2815387 RepID=UPI0025F2D79F|nr:hypothetical protein [Nostoc sp. LPT]
MTLFKSKTLSSPNDFWLIWILRFLPMIALLIIVFLILESLPILNHVEITRFFTDSSWNPTAAIAKTAALISTSVT